jgi:hypothetical protein
VKVVLRNRQAIQTGNGDIAAAIDELVNGINVQPLEVGDVKIRSGPLTPEGRLVGNIGDVFLRTDGPGGAVLYNKVSGLNTVTGWTASHDSGLWTPIDGSGAGLAFTGVIANWTKVGQLVLVNAQFSYPVTASGAAAIIGGFPFTCGPVGGSGVWRYPPAAGFATVYGYVRENAKHMQMYLASGAAYTNVQMSATNHNFSATYMSAT